MESYGTFRPTQENRTAKVLMLAGLLVVALVAVGCIATVLASSAGSEVSRFALHQVAAVRHSITCADARACLRQVRSPSSYQAQGLELPGLGFQGALDKPERVAPQQGNGARARARAAAAAQ